MDFFQQQDLARRNSKLLIALFSLAVIALITSTTAFLGFIFYLTDGQTQQFSYQSEAGSQQISQLFRLDVLAAVALVVGCVIGLGSYYRIHQLARGGGAGVAIALGGQAITPNTRDPEEKKLLNVVEEMAIAAGLPVPTVFLMEEEAINAFAAGNTTHNAVIGVTRGALRNLNRDELQGVVAHEFSHILNGDMKLNMRLLGLLHGILLIGLAGSVLMRGSFFHHSTHSRRRDKDNRIALVGIGLFAIGYIGTFFGNIIKAAVSRQREFLADASAVQFTRNPDGIANALMRLGGYSSGSELTHSRSEEFSHLFFGNSLRHNFFGWLATHPPLEERIRRLKPRWNGEYKTTTEYHATEDSIPGVSQLAGGQSTPQQSEVSVSVSDNDSVEFAQQLLRALPVILEEAAREPFSARALVYCFLIQEDDVGKQQWQHLERRAHPVVFKHTQQLHQHSLNLDPALKLPLFELALPTLKLLSEPQRKLFLENVIALIKADKKVHLLEWSLYKLLKLQFSQEKVFGDSNNASIADLGVPIQWILSFCAQTEPHSLEQAEQAYQLAMGSLQLDNLPLIDQQLLSFPKLDNALTQLQALRPLQKPLLLKAIQQCIYFDGVQSAEEYQLFKTVAECLDCPMPPKPID